MTSSNRDGSGPVRSSWFWFAGPRERPAARSRDTQGEARSLWIGAKPWAKRTPTHPAAVPALPRLGKGPTRSGRARRGVALAVGGVGAVDSAEQADGGRGPSAEWPGAAMGEAAGAERGPWPSTGRSLGSLLLVPPTPLVARSPDYLRVPAPVRLLASELPSLDTAGMAWPLAPPHAPRLGLDHALI